MGSIKQNSIVNTLVGVTSGFRESVCEYFMMTIHPTILRTKGRLSDYMAEGDRKKMKIKGKTSRPWVKNNAKDMQKFGNVLRENDKKISMIFSEYIMVKM